jgi:hypothetical protein
MALKQGQHSRIVRIANSLDIPVRYDREVECYTLRPEDMERLVMLAAMADNVFELAPDPVATQDEDGIESHR